MSHNSIGEEFDRQNNPDLPFHLTGSQRKTAYALEQNVARMVREAGEENIGFLTLTVGDETAEGFRQIWEPDEASRRINSLLTNLLRDLFPRMVIVTERHASKAIHFHLIVETTEDIRSGFDHAAFKAARAEGRGGYHANNALRALWGILSEKLTGFGFGRAELTPLEKGGEAVSRYVSKYVEKNLFARLKVDKGKKLVRYSGWHGSQMTANQFCWATPKACEWRRNAETIANLVGVRSRATVGLAFGPRWAFRVSRVMHGAAQSPARLDMQDWVQTLRNAAAEEMLYPMWWKWLEDEQREAEFPEMMKEIEAWHAEADAAVWWHDFQAARECERCAA